LVNRLRQRLGMTSTNLLTNRKVRKYFFMILNQILIKEILFLFLVNCLIIIFQIRNS